MYKIFQENKTLIFPKIDGDSLKFDSMLQESDRYESEILCDFLQEWLVDDDQTDTFIHEVGQHAVAEALKQTFRMAPAAGGIVMKDGRFVSIVRHGIPDLPKGHIEQGETPEEAALREVKEETGIDNLQIVKELPSTWHCYPWGDEWRLKRTSWFLMQNTAAIHPKPQTEEDITEIKLIGNEEVEAFIRGTFRSISEILGQDMRQIATK